MEKIEAALALFKTELATHGEKLAQNIAQQKEAKKAFRALEETCAHLRAEISSLKKQYAAQRQDSQKAGKQIDAAIQQIDEVLAVNEAQPNESTSEETSQTEPNQNTEKNIGENIMRENEPNREGDYNG